MTRVTYEASKINKYEIIAQFDETLKGVKLQPWKNNQRVMNSCVWMLMRMLL